jgi:hypothetical protein
VSGVAGAGDKPPDPTLAKQVTSFMINELVAALFTEFHETDSATAAAGKQAISLIFNDLNRDMRLVGNIRPLLGGTNDLPADPFETRALEEALAGQSATAEEAINGTWYWRTSIPLNPAALSAACCSDPANPPAGGAQAAENVCIFCHKNFNDPNRTVGALMLRVPIR